MKDALKGIVRFSGSVFVTQICSFELRLDARKDGKESRKIGSMLARDRMKVALPYNTFGTLQKYSIRLS